MISFPTEEVAILAISAFCCDDPAHEEIGSEQELGWYARFPFPFRVEASATTFAGAMVGVQKPDRVIYWRFTQAPALAQAWAEVARAYTEHDRTRY